MELLTIDLTLLHPQANGLLAAKSRRNKAKKAAMSADTPPPSRNDYYGEPESIADAEPNNCFSHL